MSFNDNNTNDFNTNEDNSFDSNSIQNSDSGLGNVDYEQPDYGDFGNSDDNNYASDNGLKKKLIIIIAVIAAIIILILLFTSLFGKNNKKINLDVPNVVYEGSEVEFVTAIPNSSKNLIYRFTSNNEDILQFEYSLLSVGDTANTMVPKKSGKVKIKVEALDNGKNVGVYENDVIVCPKFDENIFSSGDYKIGVSDDFDLNIDLGVYDECYKNIKYTSTDEDVAVISSSGIISAKKKGSTVIKVSNGYKTVTKTINVVASSNINSVTGVKLNVTSLTISVGSNGSLSAIVSPSNATNKSVVWSSSNESVALVSSKGNVVGVSPGSAIITATTQDGNKTAMANVTVKKASSSTTGGSSTGGSTTGGSTSNYIKVTKISINSDDFTIKVGNTKSLGYTITPSNATNKKVAWSTSNPAIAKVSSTGKVTGVSAGTAYITVKSVDGASDKVKVIVAKGDPIKATKIVLSPSSLTLNVGVTKKVTATVYPSNATIKTITWVSHNTSIVKVDSTGNVTGVKAGKTQISAYTTDNAVVATMNVEVKSNNGSSTNPSTPTNVAVSSLVVSPTYIDMYVNDTSTVSVSVLPSNASNKNLTWSSSDSSIATVTQSGVVKGIKYGTATIKVTSVSNSSVSKVIVVSVKNKPVEKSISCSYSFNDQSGKSLTGTALSSITASQLSIDVDCKATNTSVNALVINSSTNSVSVGSKYGIGGTNASLLATISNTTGKNNGTHVLTATATDSDGKKYTFSQTITIVGTVDTTKPYISDSGKLKSSVVSGKMTFSVTAADADSGVASVTFYYTSNATNNTYHFTYNNSSYSKVFNVSHTFTTPNAGTTYKYYVVIKDKAGNSYQSASYTSVKSK